MFNDSVSSAQNGLCAARRQDRPPRPKMEMVCCIAARYTMFHGYNLVQGSPFPPIVHALISAYFVLIRSWVLLLLFICGSMNWKPGPCSFNLKKFPANAVLGHHPLRHPTGYNFTGARALSTPAPYVRYSKHDTGSRLLSRETSLVRLERARAWWAAFLQRRSYREE